MYALPQHQELAKKFFYNINTNVKISTKKKELNPKMKMVRTHSVYIVKPIALIRLSLSIQKIWIVKKLFELNGC